MDAQETQAEQDLCCRFYSPLVPAAIHLRSCATLMTQHRQSMCNHFWTFDLPDSYFLACIYLLLKRSITALPQSKFRAGHREVWAQLAGSEADGNGILALPKRIRKIFPESGQHLLVTEQYKMLLRQIQKRYPCKEPKCKFAWSPERA